MWLTNPQGRKVNLPTRLAQYYAGLDGWSVCENAKAKPEGFPRHVGGGTYELSNGERVKGKTEAIQAETEL